MYRNQTRYSARGVDLVLRVGIIGCGANGWGHFNHLVTFKDVQVTALYDVNPEAPRSWLEKSEVQPKPQIVAELSRMWELVDAVWVTSPPGVHYEHSIAALRAGKHVFCEKPIALELHHADEMVRVAREKGLTYFIGHSHRFQPSAYLFADIVRSGKIGEISSLWATRIANPAFTQAGWRTEITMCGGMLMETFTHQLDWMRLVAGEIKEVYMKEKTVTPTVNFEDHAVGIIEFENGAIGEFLSSWSSGLSRMEWGVIGAKGAASLSPDKKQIIISYRDGNRETVDAPLVDTKLVEDRLFVESVLEGKPLPFDASDSAKTLEAHVALKLSAREGRPIRLPLTDRSLGIPQFAVERRQAV